MQDNQLAMQQFDPVPHNVGGVQRAQRDPLLNSTNNMSSHFVFDAEYTYSLRVGNRELAYRPSDGFMTTGLLRDAAKPPAGQGALWVFSSNPDQTLQLTNVTEGPEDGGKTGWSLSLSRSNPQAQVSGEGRWLVLDSKEPSAWRMVPADGAPDRWYLQLANANSEVMYVTIDEQKHPGNASYGCCNSFWMLSGQRETAAVFTCDCVGPVPQHATFQAYNVHLDSWVQVLYGKASDAPLPLDTARLVAAYACDVKVVKQPGLAGGTFCFLVLPSHRTTNAESDEVVANTVTGLEQYKNFSSYFAGGASPGTNVVTVWDAVQIDLTSLQVKTNVFTFSQSAGTLAHSQATRHDNNFVRQVAFGTACDCIGQNSHAGWARIDLRGTWFTTCDSFNPEGYLPGGTTSVTEDGQLVNLSGGGYGGGNGPRKAPGFLQLAVLPSVLAALSTGQAERQPGSHAD